MLTGVPQPRAVISVLVGVVLLGGGAVAVHRAWNPDQGRLRADPLTGTASPGRPAVTTPTPEPTSTTSRSPAQSPVGPDQTLADNNLYTVDLGGRTIRCSMRVRPPRPPLDDKDLAPYLRTVANCLVTAFSKPLAQQGFILETPRIKTYRRSLKSPCGRFRQRGAPAYYCQPNRTIYWPLTSDDRGEAYTFARLGYVGLLAHEFGHHLQAATGMLGGYGQRYARAKGRSDRYDRLRSVLNRRLPRQI